MLRTRRNSHIQRQWDPISNDQPNDHEKSAEFLRKTLKYPACYLKFDQVNNKVIVNHFGYHLPVEMLKTPLYFPVSQLRVSGYRAEFEFVVKNYMTIKLKKLDLRFKMFIRIFEVVNFVTKIPYLESFYMELETDENDSVAYSKMVRIIEKKLQFLKEITFIVKNQNGQVFFNLNKNKKINNGFTWITVQTTRNGLNYLMNHALRVGVRIVTITLDFFLESQDFRKLLHKITNAKIINFGMPIDREEACAAHKEIFSNWVSTKPPGIWNYKVTIVDDSFKLLESTMGGDGGSIPKRCELIKEKRKEERIEKAIQNAVKWRTCRLTESQLKKPIVADKLGRLYNKEAIIEAKLSKTLSKNPLTAHIRSLSDVKELKLTDNKAFKDNGPDKGDVWKDVNDAPFICPVTDLNMNGTYSFVVNWECGCVFSEKAMQEVKSETCYGCGGPMDKANIIQLNAEGELLKTYEEKVAAELAAKKSKKTKAEEGVAGPSKPTREVKEEKQQGTKRKAEHTSIQDDPNASKALKSIFTSSEEAKNQPKGHWATHNPLYF